LSRLLAMRDTASLALSSLGFGMYLPPGTRLGP
jgi:hypothetical protein